MIFQTDGELRYFQFETLQGRLCHGIFTRHGGVSPQPWESLNLGGTVGDEPERVRENRRRVLSSLGREPGSVFDVWQVHGTEVAIAEEPYDPAFPHLQADAILTGKPGLTLMMRFADCVPILLHDPVRKVAGIAHAGWLGTVRGTVRAAVEAMQARFLCKPQDILAGIGPSIGPDHYEIGHDVIAEVRRAFGQDASALLVQREGRTCFNLWAANRLLLEKAGVRQIEIAEQCTVCHNQDWFSHRAEKGRTGRFGALLALL